MTAEDRAAHVEREAVAGVLAAHVLTLHSFLSVIGECECGEWKKSSLREQDVEAAHRLHQADAVLAALPQTGDAAACVVDCEAACHMAHQPEHKREAARRLPHLPTENSGECATCWQPWPCDVALAWEQAHAFFCPRGRRCSSHLRPGDRYHHADPTVGAGK